jgi:amino acid transporter
MHRAHATVIALHLRYPCYSGAIGTGLILGTGSGLVQAGPAGLLIAYIIMGLVCFGTLSAMGELSCYMPHKRGFAGHASQFVEEGFGFAVGVSMF